MIELYYENYILINIDIPNYEEIKKKYFDNEGNKIVLLNDNYSIQSPFEYFTPVMYVDPEGNMPEWLGYLFWGLAGAVVIGAGIALMVASGGSLAIAFSALLSASYGVASATTALTVTSFILFGSAVGFIGASMLVSKDDIVDSGFNVLVSTLAGATYGAVTGLLAYKIQIGKNQSWSSIRKNYWNEKGYDRALIGSDGFPIELHHPYGKYGSKINIFEELTHTEHIQFHRMYGYGNGNGGFNRYYPFINTWGWLYWF